MPVNTSFSYGIMFHLNFGTKLVLKHDMILYIIKPKLAKLN